MKSPHYVSRVLLILMMSGIEASCLASESEAMQYPQPPQSPTVPATPDTHNAQGQEQTDTQQHFSTNGDSIDMQIVGKVPTINANDNTKLDFPAGSTVHVTIQPHGETGSTVIHWDASGCVSTKAGQSQPCQVAERSQVIALIKQLPAPPIPPTPPST